MMHCDAAAVLFTINLRSLAHFYERVADMRVIRTEDDHIGLETGSFRLTIHQIPERHAKSITIATPPVVREGGALKLALPVQDIAQARETAVQLGGMIYGREREWFYEGSTICDGYDPDGNVFSAFHADGGMNSGPE
jgi:predicted enzyme related to lactoylglutathione lyase